MSERFTKTQKLLMEYVILLIKIYNYEKNASFRDYCLKQESIETIARLFRAVFGECEYFENSRKFRTKLCQKYYGNGHSMKFPHKDYLISDDDMFTFIQIMKHFLEPLSKREHSEFILFGLDYNNSSSIDVRLLFTAGDLQHFPEYSDNNNTVIYMEDLKQGPEYGNSVLNANIHLYARLLEFMKRREAVRLFMGKSQDLKVYDSTAVMYNSYTIYTLWPLTKFAERLLDSAPQESPPNKIPSISYLEWESIIPLIRSILVDFHIAFGTFQRITACKNCPNLIFSIKEVAREFCSNKCKSRYNYNKDLNTSHCHDRQNKFLANRYQRIKHNKDMFPRDLGPVVPDYVKREDCRCCAVSDKDSIKGGQCAQLKIDNPWAFPVV